MVDHLLEMVEQCDKNKDGEIDFEEFENMLGIMRRRFPASEKHLGKVRKIFEQYDRDTSGSLGLNELAVLFQELSSKMTAYPAVRLCRAFPEQWLKETPADCTSCVPAGSLSGQQVHSFSQSGS